MKSRRVSLTGSGLCLIAALLGCSGNRSLPGMVPVRGSITFDGKPLDHGTVSFVPEEGTLQRAATGEIHGGNFKMQTTASSPGVMPGKYRVCVQCREAQPAPPPPAPGQEAAPMHMITAEAKSLIPLRYTDPSKSGLEVEVTAKMAAVELKLTP